MLSHKIYRRLRKFQHCPESLGTNTLKAYVFSFFKLLIIIIIILKVKKGRWSCVDSVEGSAYKARLHFGSGRFGWRQRIIAYMLILRGARCDLSAINIFVHKIFRCNPYHSPKFTTNFTTKFLRFRSNKKLNFYYNCLHIGLQVIEKI